MRSFVERREIFFIGVMRSTQQHTWPPEGGRYSGPEFWLSDVSSLYLGPSVVYQVLPDVAASSKTYTVRFTLFSSHEKHSYGKKREH